MPTGGPTRTLDRLTQQSNVADTQRRTYSYDAVGRLTGKEDLHSSHGPLICDDPFELNTCYREIIWNSDSTATYPYDRVGNRTDAGTSMVSSTSRYSAFGGYTLGYDYEGNLTSKTKSGYSQTYTWNDLGQLASVTTDGTTVSYVYDAFGRRVKRTQGSTVNYYVYDGNNLLIETDGSGTVVREYNYFPGVDRPYSLRVWSGGSATKYYYTVEQPGNVSGLVNTSRSVVNQYTYTPWGEAQSTTEAVSQPLRFMGRELDATTGLYNVRARWYDPALARFNSEDPIGLGGGINQYAYVGNSPTNLTDPTGRGGSSCPEKTRAIQIPIKDTDGAEHVVTACVTEDGSLLFPLNGVNANGTSTARGGTIYISIPSRGPTSNSLSNYYAGEAAATNAGIPRPAPPTEEDRRRCRTARGVFVATLIWDGVSIATLGAGTGAKSGVLVLAAGGAFVGERMGVVADSSGGGWDWRLAVPGWASWIKYRDAQRACANQ